MPALLNYISRHGFRCWANASGTISIAIPARYVADDVLFTEIETVPATAAAVRRALGY